MEPLEHSPTVEKSNSDETFLGECTKVAIGGNSRTHIYLSIDPSQGIHPAELSATFDFCETVRRVRNRVVQDFDDSAKQ
jgi:hypothetical protein